MHREQRSCLTDHCSAHIVLPSFSFDWKLHEKQDDVAVRLFQNCGLTHRPALDPAYPFIGGIANVDAAEAAWQVPFAEKGPRAPDAAASWQLDFSA